MFEILTKPSGEKQSQGIWRLNLISSDSIKQDDSHQNNVVVDFLTDSFYPGENSHLIRCGIDAAAFDATKPSCKILRFSKTVGFSKAICFPYF